MRTRNVLVTLVLALLGLVLAAGITLAASRLSSQRIGLSSEPRSAGDELAPTGTTALPTTRTTTTRTVTRTVTAAPPAPAPAPAPAPSQSGGGGKSDDYSGGGGEGGDD